MKRRGERPRLDDRYLVVGYCPTILLVQAWEATMRPAKTFEAAPNCLPDRRQCCCEMMLISISVRKRIKIRVALPRVWSPHADASSLPAIATRHGLQAMPPVCDNCWASRGASGSSAVCGHDMASRQSAHGQSRWELPFVGLTDYRSIMTKRPTIVERVAGLVRRMDGTPLCDECIADRLDLSSIAQASVVTSSASGTGGFERLRGPCGLCGEQGPVIRYNG